MTTSGGTALRIVFATWGSYGDLFPYIGLARALRERGHVPIIACAPFHRATVESAGIVFRPMRPDVDPSDTELIARVMRPRSGSEVLIKELLAPRIADSFQDLYSATQGADLLVSHPAALAAPLVAGARGIAWVSSVLAPFSFFSAYDLPVLLPRTSAVFLRRLGPRAGRIVLRIARSVTRSWTEPIRKLRNELGLPASGDPLYEGQFSARGTLALYSPKLGSARPDWPPNVQITGFIHDNTAIPMPPELERFLESGPPPIVFTLGSTAAGAPGRFYIESVAAAVRIKRRAVLLVGKDPANMPSEKLPPGLIALPEAPHELLFARAAVIVHHGGIGTLGQALRAGQPMLVVPHAHDQPDNAFRAERLGVARVCYPRAYRARRVAKHLEALLQGRGVRTRARTLSSAMQAENGLANACNALENAIEPAATRADPTMDLAIEAGQAR